MNFWASSVELYNLTERFVSGDGSVPPAFMYNKWMDSKASLLSPMQVPPRLAVSEQKLKDAIKIPLSLADDLPAVLFEQSFIEEALILAALFEFDELEAAKLLKLAEHLQSDWPELPRGLVAVMLFYDARLRRASTLKLLLRDALTVRGGQCSRFFGLLIQDGLISSLFDSIRSLNEDAEFERLDSVQALGSIEHRREVLTSFRQFLRTLNDVTLGWGTENSLTLNELNILLHSLASYDPPRFESPRGAPDAVLGLLATLTATALSQSLCDSQFFTNVRSSLESVDWLCPPLKAFVKLLIAISYGGRDMKSSAFTHDEQQLPHFFHDAFRAGALHFFLKFVIPSPWLKQSGDVCDVFSYMFVTFLSTQHPILRNLITGWGDENNDDGFSLSYRDDLTDINHLLSPTLGGPHSQHHPRNEPDSIETLLDCLSGFYQVASEVVPDCVLPYWASFNRALTGVQPAATLKDRNLYLSMFVSFAGDILPADKYAKYVAMLTSLISADESTATGAFHFLVDNAAANSDRRRVSLQHFQFTFQSVAVLLRQFQVQSNLVSSNAASSFDETELEALCNTVRLLTKVAKYSAQCRTELYTMFIANTFSLITSSVPSLLKVELFDFAAALIGSIQHSIQLWDMVDQSQLLPAADQTGQFSGGMWTELCSIETRLCSFPVTSSFMDLLAALLVYNVPIVLTERGIFEPVVAFVVDAVLPRLTNTTTTPSSTAELWRVAAPSYLILTRLLDHLVVLLSPSADPTSLWAGNLLLRHPGFLVYRALLRAGSTFFKNSVKLLKLSYAALYQDAELPDHVDLITSTASRILDLFKICLENADLFDKRLLTLPSFGADCHLSVSQMLTTVDSTAGGTVGVLGNVLSILNFIGNSDQILMSHCLLALKIMSVLLEKTDCHAAIYNFLTLDIQLQVRTITRFVNCVEGNVGVADTESKAALSKQIQIKAMEIISQNLQKVPAPNVAYILLGLFYRRPVVSSTLIELETGQVIKTCFKSIVAHLGSIQDVDVSYEGYRVLQRLCSNEKTALPVLHILRSSPPFLLSQMVEGSLVESMLVAPEVSIKHYLAVTGLFHCLTVDLHMCSTSQLDLKSYVLKAAQILLQATSSFGTDAPLLFSAVQKLSFQHESVDLAPLDRFSSFVGRPISSLIRLLGSVNVESDNAEGVRLSLFDIHRLHSSLAAIKADFLASQQASTQTQPELVQQVDDLLEDVMRYAADCNAKTELLHARVCFFEKWRELVQSVITVVMRDVEATASICFDIATVLLEKIQLSDSSDLFFPSACSLVAAVAEIIASSSCAFDATSPMSHLLKSVVNCIVYTRKANSGLESRVHLYAFLLKFADFSLKTVRHLFENADESLLQVVLFDCASNSAHTRLACLAYCMLQKFVRLDTTGRTFEALKTSKHVANICVSIANSSPTGEQYRLLEARLAFLSTLCLISSEGCLLVVNSRPFDSLLRFGFDRISSNQPVDSTGTGQPATLKPVESARLVTCFYSTLDFISSIFATLPYNRLVAGEVARFIIGNSVIFSELLSKPANFNVEWLEVSSKAFAIVCRCLSILKNVVGVQPGQVSTGVVLELGSDALAKLTPVKDAVLQALVAYSDVVDLVAAMERARPVEQMIFMLPICRIQESLLMYASELISPTTTPGSTPLSQLDTLVFSISSFTPQMKERLVSFRPDLSHLVRLLNNVALFAERAASELRSVTTLLNDLDSLSLKEVSDVIAAWHLAGTLPCDGLTPLSECREMARALLENAVQNLARRIVIVISNLNLALILLFRHYDIYLDIAGNEGKARMIGLSYDAVGRLVRAVVESCPDSCIMQLHHAVSQLANEARASGLMPQDEIELSSSLIRRIRKLTTGAKQKLDTGVFGLTDSRFRMM